MARNYFSLKKCRAHAKTNTKRTSTSKAICQMRKSYDSCVCMCVCARIFNFPCSLFLRLLLAYNALYLHAFLFASTLYKTKKVDDLLMLLFVSMSTVTMCVDMCMHACSLATLRLMKFDLGSHKYIVISIKIDAFYFQSINSYDSFPSMVFHILPSTHLNFAKDTRYKVDMHKKKCYFVFH